MRSRRASALFFALASVWASACHDWDAFDPRLGEASGGAGGATASSSTSTTGGAGGDLGGGGAGAEGGGGGGEGGVGGSPLGSVEYVATIADCIDPLAPDPDACDLENGGGLMEVDNDPLNMLDTRFSYLRFDIDGLLADKIIDSVTLRLRVGSLPNSDSNQTGDVWQVEPFVRSDLFAAPPDTVGASPAALDLGAAAEGETILIDLPTSLVAANSSVTLGLLPNTTDGVHYHNVSGLGPPALLIEYH